MTVRYLLDTDTCIDLLRGREDVTARAERVAPEDCAVSTVTTYELLAGVAGCREPGREQGKVLALVEAMHELVFHRRAAERAASVRSDLEKRGLRIGAYDLLLAGHALADGLTLVTSNTSEFHRVRGLRLEDWRAPLP